MYSHLQQSCLTQLGIERFNVQLRASVASPVEMISSLPEEAAPVPQDEPSVFYIRLGPWLLQTSSRLPVREPQWLTDLAAFIGAKVTEVSQPSAERQPINIDNFIGHTLTSTDKKQLWQLLSQQTPAVGRD